MRKSVFNLFLIILVLFGAVYVWAAINQVAFTTPVDNATSSTNDIEFGCSAVPGDTDGLANFSYAFNFTSDALLINVTNSTFNAAVRNSSLVTVSNIPDGKYKWSCIAVNATSNSSVVATAINTVFTNNAGNRVGSVNVTRGVGDGTGTNDTQANRTFTVDTAAPDTINLSTKENASNNYVLLNADFTNGSVNLVFSVHDRLSGAASCDVIVNGVVRMAGLAVNSTGTSLNTSANTANNSVSVLGFSSGVANNWSVSCIDNAGNTNSTNVTSVNITISDTVAPVINNIDQKLKFKGTVSGRKDVEATTFDFGSPVNILGCNGTDNVDYFRTNATLYIKKPGSSDFSGDIKNDTGGIEKFTFTDTRDLGLYNVNCTIRDGSGNQNSTTKNFEIIRSVRKSNFFATTDGFRQPISTGSRRDFGELSTDSVKTRISEGGAFLFQVDGETHEVLVDEIKGDTITVIVQSDPITTTIKSGESKSFDVDNDGTNDIEVNLEAITSSNRADITFTRVSTPAPQTATTEPSTPPRPSTPIITREEAGSLLKILVVVFVILLIVYFFIRIKKRPSNKLQFNRRDLGAYRDTTLQLYYK